jgi:hypothetical protein
MKYRYYSKEKLTELNDKMLSFGICNNLLDSAFNILQHPFELLKNEKKGYGRRQNIEEFELVGAFLSTVTGIELLMKAMIAVKGWDHLFSNRKKVSRDALINGEFRSLNFENCIDAIESSHGVDIDDRIKSRIEVMRVIRNKITHYYLDFSKDEILNYIAFGLDIFIEIYRSYLKDRVFDENDRTEGFEEDLSDIQQFVTARIESAKVREGNVYQLSDDLNNECQKCWTANLVLTKSIGIKCLYCGNEIDIEEYAKYHADDNTEITICKKCQKKTVITRGAHKPKCIICGDG